MTFTLDALKVGILQDHTTVQNDTAAMVILNFTGDTIIFIRFSIDGKENHFPVEQSLAHGDLLNVNIHPAGNFGWAEGNRIEWNLDYGIADPILIINKV